MTGKHTGPIEARITRLGSERLDETPAVILPAVDPHGYIDLTRRAVKVAAYAAAVVGLLLVGFIVGWKVFS